MCNYIQWNPANKKWTLHNYYIRTIDSLKETLVSGDSKDTAIKISPDEFKRRDNFVDAMSIGI